MYDQFQQNRGSTNLTSSSNKLTTRKHLTFSKNTSASKRTNSPMSKSCIRAELPVEELTFIKQKIFEISRTLSDHSKDIAMLKQSKDSFSNYSSTDTLRGSIQSDTVMNTHKMDELLLDVQQNLLQQISKIKAEILNQVPKKQELELAMKTLEGKIDVLKVNSLSKQQLTQLKSKIKKETVMLKQQLLQRINNMHEANRKVFSEIERDMKELGNNIVDAQLGKEQLFSSNRKFHSPHMIKYKEVVERMDDKRQAVVNEVTYFLDNQGHLLDSNCCYILDRNGKEIKLSQKQLQLLSAHQLLC